MLKCKKGLVVIDGSLEEVGLDLLYIVHAVRQSLSGTWGLSENEADELIDMCIEGAREMDDAEVTLDLTDVKRRLNNKEDDT